MAHVLFGDTHDWELIHDDQDIRGWDVRDANNNPIGTVGDMAVDTDREVVDAIILEDGTQFRADDVTLADGVVYVNSYGAPPGVSTRPYADTRGVRRRDADVERERREGDREIAEERAEMRREMREPDRVEEIHEGRREIAEERAEQRREMADATGYAGHEDAFRTHFRDTYGKDDLDYAEYAPAYRYGYDAAYDDRFTGRDYAASEADLRESFYRRQGYPMSDNIVWNRVKGAVRHAYESVRNAAT